MLLTNRDTEESIKFTWNSKKDLILAANSISDPFTHITEREFKIEGFWNDSKAVEEITNEAQEQLDRIAKFTKVDINPKHVRYTHLWIYEVGHVLFT